ncbi:MAG: D-inositol-3-phosphate glycosyltransferase [Acidimicrobiia bacterium]|nr:MAG: D-inositol-3-phosphate glycosyltransferase [Acidimicrobiia bacterium]
MIKAVAYIAMHTSPLLQPGTGNAGGMNVYLDRLSRTMAARDVDVTVFTRRSDHDTPSVTEITPRYRVAQIEAGPVEQISLTEMQLFAADFACEVEKWIRSRDRVFDLVHSHYWLSGRCGVRLKDALGIPLANSFHTLGKVKDAMRGSDEALSSPHRLLSEQEVIARSDCVIASTPYEFEDLLQRYGASPERLCVSPPGVDHSTFSPGSRSEAKQRLGLGEERVMLYVGRIQSHKGTDLAVQALAYMPRMLSDESGPTVLHIVGGASGADGAAELARCRASAAQLGISDRVRFFDPVAHSTLADHYRASEVVIVPSRSESFGLVAAEAQACGIPVVAANVGGLPYVVDASESGLLVDDHDPRAFASAATAILDHASFAERLSQGSLSYSQRFSWDKTATRMLELYEGITA